MTIIHNIAGKPAMLFLLLTCAMSTYFYLTVTSMFYAVKPMEIKNQSSRLYCRYYVDLLPCKIWRS